jgi:hypothetical protein
MASSTTTNTNPATTSPPHVPNYLLGRNVGKEHPNGGRKHFANNTGAGARACVNCEDLFGQYIKNEQEKQTSNEDKKEKSPQTIENEQRKERHATTGSDPSNQVRELLNRTTETKISDPTKPPPPKTKTVCNFCSGTDYEGSCGYGGKSTLGGCLIEAEKKRVFELNCNFCKENSIGKTPNCSKDLAPFGCELANRVSTDGLWIGSILRGPQRQEYSKTFALRCRHETFPGSNEQCPYYKEYGGPYGIGVCSGCLVSFFSIY